MKKILSILLAVVMVVSMIPVAVFAEETTVVVETQKNLAIAKDEYHSFTWEAPSNGTFTVEVTDANPGVKFEFVSVDLPVKVAVGTPYTVAAVAGTTYEIHCFGSKGWDDYIAASVSYTITFTPSTGDEVIVKEDYMISDSALTVGGENEITMLNDEAVVTVVKFQPEETGTYEFTVSGALIKSCGTTNYTYGYETLPEDGTNKVEWVCTDIAQHICLGIYAPDSEKVAVSLAKTAEYVPHVTEDEVYVNKSIAPVELPVQGEEEAADVFKARFKEFCKEINWTMPAETTLGDYVNVLDTETHTAVPDGKGYYRLDRADGPVLLIDMDYMGIILSDAMFSERPFMAITVKESETKSIRYDIGAAVMSYEVNCDNEGYYPLTDDLIFFYKNYTDWGFYAPEAYGDGTNEDVWMYCCRALITEDTVLEPENPLEGTWNVDQNGVEWTPEQSGKVYFTAEPADCAVGIYDYETLDILYSIENGVGEYEVTEGAQYVIYPVDEAYEGTAVVNWSYNPPAGGDEGEDSTVGTKENPEVLEELNWYYGDVSQEQGDEDGYFYTWTAAADGVATFYYGYNEGLENYKLDIVVNNTTASVQKTLLEDGVDNYGLELQMDVSAGDVLEIAVIAVEDAEGNPYPAAEMTWCGNFAYPAGTEQNPINIEWNWNDEYTTATANVTVEAGKTVYYNGNSDMILTVDSIVTEQSSSGVFTITNSGEAEATYALMLATPVGAYSNPDVIEEIYGFEDSKHLESDESYYYIWTAAEDATLTLDVTEGANITVDNVDTSVQYVLAEPEMDENYNNTGWTVAENLTFDVLAGQTIKIQVNGLTDWSNWSVPAVDYTLTITGTPKNAALIGDVAYSTVAEALDAAVSGDVVKLNKDAEVADVKVAPGVTLDLNGHTLTAEYVAVFNTANIADNSADNTGFLKVAMNNVIITTGNSQMPVWNGEGYVFSAVDFSRSMLNPKVEITDDQFGYAFQPQFQAAAKALLSDGAEDNGVTIEVRISWETPLGREYRNLVYNEKQIKTVIPAPKGAFTLTVTGLSGISGLTGLTVEAVVRSATGVCSTSTGIAVNLAK